MKYKKLLEEYYAEHAQAVRNDPAVLHFAKFVAEVVLPREREERFDAGYAAGSDLGYRHGHQDGHRESV